MRGNRWAGDPKEAVQGSIPACAGEPPGSPGRSHQHRVYPRVCGGTPTRTQSEKTAEGLSPRVRGNHLRGVWGQNIAGSIPACAGEPSLDTVSIDSPTVYPRVCGGTAWIAIARRPVHGLSPRVRGNLTPADHATGVRRSIPACAGEPPPTTAARGDQKVYPRVCGGTLPWAPSGEYIAGLSPRVRGNPSTVCDLELVGGSIPACAGEPNWPRAERNWTPVYPRVCGGTAWEYFERHYARGLSPRVRGNRGD